LGLLPYLFSIWPNLQQRAHLASGPSFMHVSTQYHSATTLIPFLTILCSTLLPLTMKTTDNTAISAFCHLSLMVRWFATHLTWVGITMPTFSYSNS
jgi:hypothetical protein